MAVKLGNGNWAVKEDKLLAYNDNSGLFFNKEFDFSRGTSATYVAKDGLIKTAGIQPNIVNNGDFSELGSELVTNGDFSDGSSNWVAEGGSSTWVIDNVANKISSSNFALYQSVTRTVGKIYKISFDIVEYTSGSLKITLGNGVGKTFNTAGSKTVYLEWDGSDDKIRFRSSFIGSIDNISVKEVDPNDYWTFGSDWTVADGKATYGGNANGNALTQSNLFTVSGRYRVKFTISDIASGQGRIYMSNTSLSEVYLGLTYVNNQSYSFDFDATATNNLVIRGYNSGGGQSFSISNITVQQIETDTPRIDFTNDTKGHLLLEPSRTNTIQNSEITSTWTYTEYGSGSAGTITTGKTDMFGGTNAAQVDFPSDAENVSITFGQTGSPITSGSDTISLYIKLVESGSKTLQLRASSAVTSLINVNSTDFIRYEVTGTKTSNEGFNLKLRPSAGTSSGGFSIIICHPQEEAGSYATSYIPTTGAASTRNADVCNNSGSAQDFNDSEGVLYAEIAALQSTSSGSKFIAISDGTYNNRASILFSNLATNQIRCFLRVGGVSQVDKSGNVTDVTDFNKVAFSYKENEFKMFVNGSQVGSTDTSGSVWSSGTITKLSLTEINSALGAFNGKVRNVQVFTEALTDEQLEKLTS